ncbi:motA/TolQ/ExbB proton channel family protein [Psychromonas sp. CNPT3]|uniref:MotA/TolQ/ExbB proton channel family protein n=1 Tax=Psychromonas sp. CNPT3 TaxID=314282 RepID=UPI00006E9E5F|nr:MotA/TolQ/ExbB proton channel family protein [Psychromonas sp. CNPT3]AGH82348.1 motA/TolQ/ExbB proton channel family protein [Psychromonas sp. CNPT3]
MNKYIGFLLFLYSLSVPATPLDAILEQVKKGNLIEQKQAKAQIYNAHIDVKKINKRLFNARKTLKSTNNENVILEDRILQLQAQIKQRRAQYQSQQEGMQGVFKSVADHGDIMLQRTAAYGLWKYDRSNFIQKDKGNINNLHIRQLWIALIEQILMSSKIIQDEQQIVLTNGTLTSQYTVQFGPFNAYSQIQKQYHWLTFLPGQKIWQQITPEPTTQIDTTTMQIDPSFGQLLIKESRAPNWYERLKPAGTVGVLIILLGIIGGLICAIRMWALHQEEQKIQFQLKHSKALSNNALGRVILATEKSDLLSLDALLDEAILKEVPTIKKGISTLAVIASIPPLLGLLGTVAGMIETFRVITEQGNSDSQLLAGGISQALLTTELGLMVAIPLLLLHCLLRSKSIRLIEILEQQSAGLLVLRQHDLRNINE